MGEGKIHVKVLWRIRSQKSLMKKWTFIYNSGAYLIIFMYRNMVSMRLLPMPPATFFPVLCRENDRNI